MNKRKSTTQYPEPFLNHVDRNKIADSILDMVSSKVQSQQVPKNPTPTQGYTINDWIVAEQQIMTSVQNQQLDDSTRVASAKLKFGLMFAMIPYLLLSPMNLAIMASSFKEFCTELDEEASLYFISQVKGNIAEIWNKLKYTNSKDKQGNKVSDAIIKEIDSLHKDSALNHAQIVKLIQQIRDKKITKEDLSDEGIRIPHVFGDLKSAFDYEESRHPQSDDFHSMDSHRDTLASENATPRYQVEPHDDQVEPHDDQVEPHNDHVEPHDDRPKPKSKLQKLKDWGKSIIASRNKAKQLEKQEEEIKHLVAEEEQKDNQQKDLLKERYEGNPYKRYEDVLSLLKKNKNISKEHTIKILQELEDDEEIPNRNELIGRLTIHLSELEFEARKAKPLDKEPKFHPDEELERDVAQSSVGPSTTAQSIITQPHELKTIDEAVGVEHREAPQIVVACPYGAKNNASQKMMAKQTGRKQSGFAILTEHADLAIAQNRVIARMIDEKKESQKGFATLVIKAKETMRNLVRVGYIPINKPNILNEYNYEAYKRVVGVDIKPFVTAGYGKHIRRR